MPVYRYKAKDPGGKTVTHTMEAANEGEAAQHLREQGYFPISIKQARAAEGEDGPIVFFERLKPVEQIMFTRQLVTLYKAGIPLVAGLASLEQQATTPLLKRICRKLKADVQAGSSLSDAFAAQPKFFDELFINTVRAGEKGGVLDQVLIRLATLLEHEQRVKGKIKGALRYPMIVILGLVGVVISMLIFVIPKFDDLFSGMGQELPLPTRILMGASRVVTGYAPYLVVAVIAFAIGFRYWLKTPAGRLVFDSLKLKLPIFGSLVLKLSMGRFATMFGTLAKSGVPVLENLDICASTLGNAAISKELREAREKVEKGQSLSSGLEGSPFFLPMIVHMLAVGERTGDTEGMMEVVAGHYDMEAEYTIGQLTTMIEPVMTLIIGSMILFVALSIFMPLWNVGKAFKG